MNIPGYAIDISLAYDYYEFISVGKKGTIKKAIFFLQEENRPSVYHLIMGDVNDNEVIDVEIITNNGDMEKVLSTVVTATYTFLLQYSDCHVIIKGSNEARTRLYRMAINVNYEALNKDFDIFGIFELEEIVEHFENGTVKDYDSFLIKRKK